MSGHSTEAITMHERWVIDRAGRGVFAAFDATPSGKPTVRASVIRALLLGQARHGLPGTPLGMPGLRISGALIEGKLDLADCARPGGGLPALVLEDCDIPEPIDLSASRLAKLSLARSRFGFVNLRGADIDGPFDFSGASGLEDADCWIDACGVLVNDDLIGERGRLRVRIPADEPAGLAPGDRRRALWLAGATIRGSVRLTDGFAADGGISLDAARVTGDVRIDGGSITSEDGYALRAQNANIDGIMLIRNSRFEGRVWLIGLRTGGALQMRDTWITGFVTPDGGPGQAFPEMRDAETPDLEMRPGNAGPVADEPRNALIIADADIGASVRLTPNVTVHGRTSFATTKIRGDLDATGAGFHQSPAGPGRAVQLTNAEIGASLILDDIDVRGRLDMAGARIGGKLSLLGATLSNRTDDGESRALDAINVTIGGNAEFGRDGSAGEQRGARIKGAVDFTSSHILGNLAFTGAEIENLSAGGMGCAIVARQVRVQASIQLDGNFRARGAVILTGATVGRDLSVDKANLYNPEYSAIYAKDIEVGDDIKLLESDVTGHLRFERAMVAGSVYWQKLILRMEEQPNAPRRRLARLEFIHARIGSTLKCAGIDFRCACRIDFRGLRVATIDLVLSSRGLGNSHHGQEYCPIVLDGMIYERIMLPDLSVPVPTDPDDAAQLRQAQLHLRMRAQIPVKRPWTWALPARDKQTDLLLDWILRDSSNDAVAMQGKNLVAIASLGQPRLNADASFNPQPFRQLTRVLRTQGYEGTAREIAIYEQWAAPRKGILRQLLRFIYGGCFGFGLWPRRAAFTLAFYVAIGWLATIAALECNWLIQTPLIAATNYRDSGQGGQEFAFMLADQKGVSQHELACTEITDPGFDALVYAADTVLPFIPLHQETKCEVRRDLHFLRFARACYTVLGWIITSLALLTFTGFVKGVDRDSG